jgi:hypothetical protein
MHAYVSRGSSSRLLAQGSPEPSCARGSSSLLPPQVSSIAATCPVAPALTSCLRVAPGPLRVLRGSIGCEPLKKINILWQHDHHDLYRGAHVSFNALCDKGGVARLQSMQQVAH